MKFALRQLAKSPGFTVIALITLALGIGVTTTAFTVLNRVLLQSLPYEDPSRIVQFWATNSQPGRQGLAPGDYFDLKAQSATVEKMALYYVNYMASFADAGKPAARSISMAVTADFLPLLGINPVLGRTFSHDQEEHRDFVIILSNSFWQKQYGGDPHVLGRSVRANGNAYTIIGVMPAILDDPMLFGGRIDFWNLDNTAENRTLRDKGWYQGAGRRKAGVSLEQAQAEMTTIASRFAREFPKTNFDRGFKVIQFPTNTMDEVGARLTWLIMALSLGVLLIACVNLANLQLVRTTGRGMEMAIRLALGASRAQLLRLLLSESLLLSIVGGALGLLVAKWSNSYLAKYLEVDMPLDLRVIGFALITSAATGAFFGSLPAWLASRADVNKGLKQSARGSTSDRSRHRLRQTLIVVELALALTLLAGAGYFVRGIQRLTDRDLGWRGDNVLVGIFSLPHDRYGEERDERSRIFADRFRAELLALPGVDRAVISRGTPVFGLGGPAPFMLEGSAPPAPGKETMAFSDMVGPGFFELYGMHLVQGRDFIDTDLPGSSRVVIVNQAFARKFWPNENAVGKRVGSTDPTKPEWWEIVGVVNDIRAPGDPNPPGTSLQIFHPFAQDSMRFLTFSVHSPNDVRTLKEGIRHVLARFEPDIAINFMETVQEFMKLQLGGFALVRRLLVEIACLGLLLAGVGIYGVVANLASERTQEIGIRMALGAQASDVQWLFLRDGLRLATIGTVLGLGCAFGLMHVLNTMLTMVPGNDPWVVIGVAALLMGVALIACWLPARRATKVNPLVALRAE